MLSIAVLGTPGAGPPCQDTHHDRDGRDLSDTGSPGFFDQGITRQHQGIQARSPQVAAPLLSHHSTPERNHTPRRTRFPQSSDFRTTCRRSRQIPSTPRVRISFRHRGRPSCLIVDDRVGRWCGVHIGSGRCLELQRTLRSSFQGRGCARCLLSGRHRAPLIQLGGAVTCASATNEGRRLLLGCRRTPLDRLRDHGESR